MALVVHDKHMDIPDIMKWIGLTFVYYVPVLNLYDEKFIDYSSTKNGQDAIVLDDYLLSGLYALRLPQILFLPRSGKVNGK